MRFQNPGGPQAPVLTTRSGLQPAARAPRAEADLFLRPGGPLGVAGPLQAPGRLPTVLPEPQPQGALAVTLDRLAVVSSCYTGTAATHLGSWGESK